MSVLETVAPPRSASGSGQQPGAWWLSPIGGALLIGPVSLFGAWAISDARYRAEWRTPKALTDSFTVLMLLGLVALVVGASWWQLRPVRSRTGRWPVLTDDHRAVLQRAATWTFRATIFGYLALTALGLARGVSPVTLLTSLLTFSTNDGMKNSFAPVAGVSSFTQIGIVHVVIAGLLFRRRRDPRWNRHDRRARRRLGIVLGLALLRSFLLSERLAILELAVPLLAILALRWSVDPRGWVRRACRLAPVVLLPLLLAVFGLFEYTRSWKFYSAHGGTSFWDFAAVRFAGYYATAYNNAAIAQAHGGFPGRLPYSVFESFWTAPVLSQLGLYQRLSGGDAESSFHVALVHYGNPEFNNPGGLGAPFVDLGTLGGVLYLLLLGALCGWCWTNLRSGGMVGMLVYPVVLTGLYELPRYLYLSQGRVLPALVVLLLLGRRLERGVPAAVALRVRRRLPGVPVRRTVPA
ncbi:MAG: hypothetical protein JWO98_4397 [Frankiales bacterium]|nr:hypothetical protein [Frankiales bacterium]